MFGLSLSFLAYSMIPLIIYPAQRLSITSMAYLIHKEKMMMDCTSITIPAMTAITAIRLPISVQTDTM